MGKPPKIGLSRQDRELKHFCVILETEEYVCSEASLAVFPVSFYCTTSLQDLH